MNKLWLIAQYEYERRVLRRSFLPGTVSRRSLPLRDFRDSTYYATCPIRKPWCVKHQG